MKPFIEPSGKFFLKIPLDWEYQIPTNESIPHAFEKYQKKVGTFQISCKEINEHTLKLIRANRLTKQDAGKGNLEFYEKINSGKLFDVYLWIAFVVDHLFFITYTFESKKRSQRNVNFELLKVRKSLPTIFLIEPKKREKFLIARRFEMFMFSLATTIDLINTASQNGSFIELVVLEANKIDGLLRLSIILTDQISQKNSDIDISLLFQNESDKPISERDIYKRALSKKIINQELYNELETLYNERNKVVHRFLITDIKTRDVLKISIKYGALQNKIGNVLTALEQEQFKLGVGIYGTGNPPDQKIDKFELKRLFASVKDKHGRFKISRKLSFE